MRAARLAARDFRGRMADKREYWKRYHQTPEYKERNRRRMREPLNKEAHKFTVLSRYRLRKILEAKI